MKLLATCLLLAVSMKACISSWSTDVPDVHENKTMGAVVVGMGNSQKAGSCPGAELDARNMSKLLGAYTDNVTLLLNSSATKSVVTKALEKAISKYELVVFFYSGHGGSGFYSGDGEDDGKDEFLCLYDKYMVDDEIWDIISESEHRVFLIFDCCHSGSMYRTAGFNMRSSLKRLSASNKKKAKSGFEMLCWSGCDDDNLSYGDSAGGEFTNTLLKHFNKSYSYDTLWDKISRDKSLLSFEEPQETNMGFNTDKLIFR